MRRSDAHGILCLVTDRSFCPAGQLRETLARAIDNGVNMIQYREKPGPGSLSDRDSFRLALAIRELCADRGVDLIVDDRLDLAMAIEADGVHLGQGDLPVTVARRLWPAGRLFGVSASSLDEAVQAVADGADYVGFGAVFPTATKTDVVVSNLAEMARVVAASPVPVIAIGGIKLSNAAAVMASGCAGIAVVSAVLGAADPGAASRQLADLIRNPRRTAALP